MCKTIRLRLSKNRDFKLRISGRFRLMQIFLFKIEVKIVMRWPRDRDNRSKSLQTTLNSENKYVIFFRKVE
jgi:hypothetical protein